MGRQAVEELLLDTGLHSFEVTAQTLERDTSLPRPEQSESRTPRAPKHYPLSAFRYDPEADVYRCPVRLVLTSRRRYRGRAQRPYTQYGTPACATCDPCAQP